MCTDVLILAGGSGERLWPVSTPARPKQFMALGDGESFLGSAIRRAWALGVSGEICVVTRRDWIDLVVADVIALAASLNDPAVLDHVLVMSEPCGKNTAPAIYWTAKYLLSLKRRESVNMLMMASDHIIKPVDSFVRDAETASCHAKDQNLVSFAIPPVSPATGYGYIQSDGAMAAPFLDATPAFKVQSFREKPDAATARSYIEDGHYYWNSGLYAFRADFYVELSKELSKLYSPEIVESFKNVRYDAQITKKNGVRVLEEPHGLEAAYERTPSISIDYAISEKCERSVAVRASFLWDDVGTWDSLAKYFDELPASAVAVESKNCFVHSEIPVALCGVDDLVVVIRNGKALISRKGETNLVKDALTQLKQKDRA